MAKRNDTPERRSSKEKLPYRRQLKVRRGYYDQNSPYTKRWVSSYKVPEPVPWIYEKGYWLKRAGFQIGMPVQVKVYQGCLVLRAMDMADID